MELPGSAYLYTLATLSMTFVGFCAIVIVLRQTVGKELSGWHIVLTRLYIESGFWAAAFCMLLAASRSPMTAPGTTRTSPDVRFPVAIRCKAVLEQPVFNKSKFINAAQ